MNNGGLSQKGGSLKGRLLQHEKLAKYTSWHVGGVADQLYFPFDRMKNLPNIPVGMWVALPINCIFLLIAMI